MRTILVPPPSTLGYVQTPQRVVSSADADVEVVLALIEMLAIEREQHVLGAAPPRKGVCEAQYEGIVYGQQKRLVNCRRGRQRDVFVCHPEWWVSILYWSFFLSTGCCKLARA